MSSPSFIGRRASSPGASRRASSASRKQDTRCEVRLRSHLWRHGLRFRKSPPRVPGKPDIVFGPARLAVFCDGDFWHGRNWRERRCKLARGANPDYWIAKIEANMARDRAVTERLEAEGWRVLRFWESEITADVERVTAEILLALDKA